MFVFMRVYIGIIFVWVGRVGNIMTPGIGGILQEWPSRTAQ